MDGEFFLTVGQLTYRTENDINMFLDSLDCYLRQRDNFELKSMR